MRALSIDEIGKVSGGCPEEGQEYCWEDLGPGNINIGRLMDAAQDYWDWAGDVAYELENWFAENCC